MSKLIMDAYKEKALGLNKSTRTLESSKLTRDLALANRVANIGRRLVARSLEAQEYDPRQAVVFWEKMSEVKEDGGFEFLSTHPADETRIKDIKYYISEI